MNPTISAYSGEERLVGCLAAIWIRMVARRFCRPEITEVAVGRITERLAAVFRRSHGDNRPVASAVAVPSSVPRPLALVVVAGSVVVAEARFAPVARSAEFVAAVAAEQRIALRLPTTEYGTVMRELMHSRCTSRAPRRTPPPCCSPAIVATH
jgi:hypothetical protein